MLLSKPSYISPTSFSPHEKANKIAKFLRLILISQTS